MQLTIFITAVWFRLLNTPPLFLPHFVILAVGVDNPFCFASCGGSLKVHVNINNSILDKSQSCEENSDKMFLFLKSTQCMRLKVSIKIPPKHWCNANLLASLAFGGSTAAVSCFSSCFLVLWRSCTAVDVEEEEGGVASFTSKLFSGFSVGEIN